MATKRHLWFVTGPAAFKVPIVRHLLKYFNVLPLHFGKGMEAIDAAVKKLQNKEGIILSRSEMKNLNFLLKFLNMTLQKKQMQKPLIRKKKWGIFLFDKSKNA